MYMMYLICT